MIISWQTAKLGAGALGFLILALRSPLGCDRDIGPCEYEYRSLSADDPSPWGTRVGDDIAAMSGPQPGTWTWGPSTEEIAIEPAGQVIEVEASFEADEASFRLREHVGEAFGCYGPTVQADGVLHFWDQDGVSVVSVPVTAQRSLGASPRYYAVDLISPVSAFSDQLTELSGFDDTSIRVLANWGREGELREVMFDYIGQEIDDSGGVGVIVTVARFE